MPITATEPPLERNQSVPVLDDGEPPPPAGSIEEALATAQVVGWPGAFRRTCNDVEREILSLLLWEM